MVSDNLQGNTSRRAALFFILALVSLLSGVFVFVATANGPMGYSDSVAYIVSARNLIKGIGLGMFTPGGRFVITYLHPPLYPLLLSGMGMGGGDLLDVARLTNVILASLTVFTTGYIFLRHSQIPELSIVAGTLTVIFPTILTMFMSAMSEALFLFLLSLGCLLLLNYLQKQSISGYVAAALAFGLLPVTRYVGAAFIIPAVLCVYLFSAGSMQARLKRVVVFGLLTAIPLIVWFSVLSTGTSKVFGGRSIQIDAAQLMAGLYAYRDTAVEILWNWIPFSKRSVFSSLQPIRGTIMIVGFIAISAVTWVAGKRLGENKDKIQTAPDVIISFFFGVGFVSYYFVFMATWLFTIPQTPINDRLLMPLYYTAIMGLVGCLAVWQGVHPTRINLVLRFVPWGLILLMTYWYFPQVIDVFEETYQNDTVLAYHWRDSRIFSALENIPANVAIISNKPVAIAMWADRPAYDLMDSIDPEFMSLGIHYGSDDTDAIQKLFRQKGVLVVFDDFPHQLELAYGKLGHERLPSLLDGLVITGQYPDGIIYRYAGE